MKNKDFIFMRNLKNGMVYKYVYNTSVLTKDEVIKYAKEENSEMEYVSPVKESDGTIYLGFSGVLPKNILPIKTKVKFIGPDNEICLGYIDGNDCYDCEVDSNGAYKDLHYYIIPCGVEYNEGGEPEDIIYCHHSEVERI